MADVRFKLNSDAVDELMKQLVQSDLTARGERVLAVTGSEFYEMQTWVGRRRFRVTIRTKDASGAAHEAKHHTLLTAFDAARG